MNIKIGYLVVLVILTVATVWYFQKPKHPDEVLRAEVEAVYRADVYGGTTPEETLELFVAALEKGDAELASKYFEIENQEEMKKEMELGLKNGAAKLFIASVSGNYVIENPNDLTRHFLYSGKTPPLLVSFYLNTYSNKWKLGKF